MADEQTNASAQAAKRQPAPVAGGKIPVQAGVRGAAGPKAGPQMVYTWPHLVSIEAIAAIAFTLVLTVMAIAVNAPLRGLANPESTPNPSKAPWYFLGLQELLLHMHPALAGVIVPTIVLVGLAAIPYFDTSKRGTAIWFYGRRGVKITILSIIYTLVVETALILIDEFVSARRISDDPQIYQPYIGRSAGDPRGLAALTRLFLRQYFGLGKPAAWIGEIIVPSIIMGLVVVGLLAVVKRRYRPDRREVMIALFSFFFASFVLLTIVGTAFRGESMLLTWPWLLEEPFEPGAWRPALEAARAVLRI